MLVKRSKTVKTQLQWCGLWFKSHPQLCFVDLSRSWS